LSDGLWIASFQKLPWLRSISNFKDSHGCLVNLGSFYVTDIEMLNVGRSCCCRKAAKRKMDARCMFAYAMLLEQGDGIPADPIRAYAFYQLSQDIKPTRDGTARLVSLEKQLSAADQERARVLVRQIRQQFFGRHSVQAFERTSRN
jgi:hypothetical protein